MQIVIDIPDKDIPQRQDFIDIPLHFIDGKVCSAGGKYGFMVLPPHGRLIDADAYIDKYSNFGWLDEPFSIDEFNNITPTILESWKGENK